MADFDSGDPIRTQLPSQANYDDVIIKLGDATNPATQQATVDIHGSQATLITNAAGTATTSQANGAQQALDVGINVAGIQIDPRDQGSPNTDANGWPIKITDGTSVAGVAAASTAAADTQPALVTAFSPNSPLPTGANVIGSVNQGTSPWLTQDAADGSATGGTAGSLSMLAGGIFNTALPTLTSGQQASIQLDSSGRVIIRPLTAADIVTSAQGAPNTVGNAWPTLITDGTNTAAVKAASTPAVATDPALVVAMSPNSLPLPVIMAAGEAGTPIDAYNTASAVAAGATSNHTYTVSAGKTLQFQQVEASGSGKMKIEVQIETGVATGTFVTRFVMFNSTNNPNMSLKIIPVLPIAAGVRVQVIRTNRDLEAQDLYSTIGGSEA